MLKCPAFPLVVPIRSIVGSSRTRWPSFRRLPRGAVPSLRSAPISADSQISAPTPALNPAYPDADAVRYDVWVWGCCWIPCLGDDPHYVRCLLSQGPLCVAIPRLCDGQNEGMDMWHGKPVRTCSPRAGGSLLDLRSTCSRFSRSRQLSWSSCLTQSSCLSLDRILARHRVG